MAKEEKVSPLAVSFVSRARKLKTGPEWLSLSWEYKT